MNCNGDVKIAAAASFFESALRLWGNLPSCRAVERGGVLLVSTGTAVADQNYALRTGGGDIKGMVREAGEFFRSEGMPYSWWIPPGREAAAESAGVAGAGLPLLCSPPAMVMSLRGEGLSRAAPRGLEFIICRNSAEAGEWAAASLSGFGSGPEHLGAFSAFARAMAAGPSAESFRLVTLRTEGTAAATAMLTVGHETAGLFYFSVTPRFRRRSLGSALLDFVLEEARRAGRRSVALQASPMGAPLYRGAGFAACGSFMVHSTYSDAC